jgi:hypothetical protein
VQRCVSSLNLFSLIRRGRAIGNRDEKLRVRCLAPLVFDLEPRRAAAPPSIGHALYWRVFKRSGVPVRRLKKLYNFDF